MKTILAFLVLSGWVLAGVTPARAAGSGLGGMFVPPPTSQDQCFGERDANSKNDLQFSLIDRASGKSLLAWGEVGDGDASRFSDALDAAGPVQEVLFCSNGGSLEDGINIGYLIREHKLGTRLPSGYTCISACNFMFMGGIVRTIEPGADFEVHMFASQDMMSQLKEDTAKQDWTIAYYALSHPSGMVGLENDNDFIGLTSDYASFSVAFAKQHKDLIQTGLQQYLQAHPKNKLSIDDFLKTDDAKSLIESDVLRNFAIQEDIKAIQQDSAQTAAEIAEFLVKMELSLHFLTAFSNIPNDAPRPLSRAELIEYNIINTD